MNVLFKQVIEDPNVTHSRVIPSSGHHHQGIPTPRADRYHTGVLLLRHHPHPVHRHALPPLRHHLAHHGLDRPLLLPQEGGDPLRRGTHREKRRRDRQTDAKITRRVLHIETGISIDMIDRRRCDRFSLIVPKFII